MTPEEILKQQTAIARAFLAENKSYPSPYTDAYISGYDADLGQNIIQLSDGSIRYADALTNGSVGIGDPILFHQGMGAAHIDDLPHILTSPNTVKPRILATDSLKILFSVIEDGIQKFYVGGDRPVPQLIFEIDTTIYNPSNYNFGFEEPPTEANRIHGYLSNLGAKKNDWVVGIKYSKWDEELYEDGDDVEFLSIIRPTKPTFEIPANSYTDNTVGITYPDTVDVVTYSDYETTGIGLLRWRGAGLWISDLQNLLASRYYWWENALEDFRREIIFEDGTIGQEAIQTATPPEWEFNSNFIPPWSAIASYNYSKTDHDGIRNLFQPTPLSTSETWVLVDDHPDYLYNYDYSSPNNSYIQTIDYNIHSSISTSTLSAPSKPYSWSSYTEGNYFEPVKGAGIGASTFNWYGSRGYSLSRYEAVYYSLDGVRKFLLIDTADFLRSQDSATIIQEDYNLKLTESNFSGFRFKAWGGDYQSWSRSPEIYDVSGTNYLLKNASSGIATSKRSGNSFNVSKKINGEVIRIIEPTQSRYEQIYSETVLVEPKLQTCLFKKITVDSTLPLHLQEPTTTTYYIYRSSDNTQYQIQGELEINPRLSTFIKKSGGKLITLDEVPENIKTEDAIIEFIVTSFNITGSTASIGTSTTMRRKINSLNIDTNLQHCIENISYFSS